jgi:hypothetical protein
MTCEESIAINYWAVSSLAALQAASDAFNGRTALAELNSRIRSLQIMIIEFFNILPPEI